jgi:hypothetical protein
MSLNMYNRKTYNQQTDTIKMTILYASDLYSHLSENVKCSC